MYRAGYSFFYSLLFLNVHFYQDSEQTPIYCQKPSYKISIRSKLKNIDKPFFQPKFDFILASISQTSLFLLQPLTKLQIQIFILHNLAAARDGFRNTFLQINFENQSCLTLLHQTITIPFLTRLEGIRFSNKFKACLLRSV